MNTNINIQKVTPQGFKVLRVVKEKGYPFTWLNVYFTYRGRTYEAGFKDARQNLHDFEDTDTAIRVYDEKSAEWHHFITKAYIESVADSNFDGKTDSDAELLLYFGSCFKAVEELTSSEPLA